MDTRAYFFLNESIEVTPVESFSGGIGNTRGLLSQDKWNNRTDTKIELTMMLKFSSFSYF